MNATDTDVFMLLVAKKIRDRRKLLHISQQALGDTAGISRVTVGNLERGHQNITIKHLVKVADALNCDISDLMPRMR